MSQPMNQTNQTNEMSQQGLETANQNLPVPVNQNLPVPVNQNLPVPVNQTLPMQIRQTWQQHRVPITIGLGVVVLTPILLPVLKPLAKATIKGGVSLYEKTKGALAESGEVLGDIVAEAKSELAAEAQQKANLNSNFYSANKQ